MRGAQRTAFLGTLRGDAIVASPRQTRKPVSPVPLLSPSHPHPSSPGHAGIRYAVRARRIACAAALALLLAACASTRVPPGYYRVESGDTLTQIAREHRQSVSDLIRWNRLDSANRIDVGQVLRVTPPGDAAPSPTRPAARSGSGTKSAAAKPDSARPADTTPLRGIQLVWPAQGTLAQRFNGSSSQGLRIVNAAGTPVVAAAAGSVVYASNGLRGYGNLVILRHTSGFLTIYAHNRRLLVKQGQQVTQGQKIAEMGNTDSKQVELYFELRQSGKPVDPARALPPR
nr:M23 family metallopeptidase [Bordetella bronchialis]